MPGRYILNTKGKIMLGSGSGKGVKRRVVFVVLCFLLFLCPCLYANKVIGSGKGDFIFKCEVAGKPCDLKVYYYAPEKLMKGSRIVFVLHGDGRNGAIYRDEWQRYARQYNFLLICPEFSETDYWSYNCGFIYDYNKKAYATKDKWTFNVIENLFDLAKEDKGIVVGSYCLFGHSSGAQFVQKMVMFMPEARVSLAIANGAGWYTLPNYKQQFYTGLKNTSVKEVSLKKSFKKKVIILMGEKDYVSKKMPNSYEETTEDWDRLWRAKFFFKESKAKAEAMGAEFNWRFVIVPGADHNNPNHALTANRYISISEKNIEMKREKEGIQPKG